VHLGHHFPSDVAAGAILGVASGSVIAWMLRMPATL
jgi:membrane-associated phospholipid phosphatase